MAILTSRFVLALAACCVAFLFGCNPDRAVTEGPKPSKDAGPPAPPSPYKATQPDAGRPAPAAPNPVPKPPAPQPSPKADKPTEAAKDRPPNPDPKPPAPGPPGVVPIDSFLGISSDFKAYAMSDAGGVKIVDVKTGKSLPSPTWDDDWGSPLSVTFSEDAIAVSMIQGAPIDSSFAVRVFSRKTGELEQKIHHDIRAAALTPDGRFLAMMESRSGPMSRSYLVIRDIQKKKTIAEVDLGDYSDLYSLAVAGNRVAAWDGAKDQITVVQADTGTVVKKFRSQSFLNRKEIDFFRLRLAMSPSGKLLAFEADDDIVLYDIDGGKVAQRLEGHLDQVRAFAFSPNGETLASTAKDNTLRFWNVKEGKEVNVVKDLPKDAAELIFSADGKKIAVIYRSESSKPKAEIRSVGAD